MSTMQWFGRRYDAPAWEDMTEIPTPVGQLCSMCSEEIGPDDVGITMPHGDYACDASTETELVWTVRPQHVGCHLRSMLGSLEHLDGKCHCVTGEHVESDLTWRQQGRLVMARLGWEEYV